MAKKGISITTGAGLCEICALGMLRERGERPVIFDIARNERLLGATGGDSGQVKLANGMPYAESRRPAIFPAPSINPATSRSSRSKHRRRRNGQEIRDFIEVVLTKVLKLSSTIRV